MKYLFIFLTFVSINLFSQGYKERDYSICYTSLYRSNTTETKKTIVVLIFKTDSVRLYIHEIGFVWWKINNSSNKQFSGGASILMRGEFYISHGVHTGYVLVGINTIFIIIRLEGNPIITLNIELTRNNMIENKFYEDEKINLK